ncbi:MAG: hypothetical protein ACHBN1_38315 [Heteroscytonema crispum UTEX LB 1556]
MEGNFGFGGIIGGLIAILFLLWLALKLFIWTGKIILIILVCITAIGILLVIPALIIMAMNQVFQGLQEEEYNILFSMFFLILTIACGTSIGFSFLTEGVNYLALTAVAITASPLATILIYPHANRRRLIAKYRDSEQHLIKP